MFLITVGIISYKINNSYALFTDEVTSSKTIIAKVSFDYQKTFNYTGDVQEYIVPKTGTYKIELWGASGNNNYNSYTKANPTYGSYTAGNIELTAGEKLYFYVGGMSQTFNCCSKQGERAGSGGATDIRLTNGNWDDKKSLASRIMVAGGAGGSYSDTSAPTGGHAGGLSSYAVSHSSYPIYASNQTSGGSAGKYGTAGTFGVAGINTSVTYNSGGGGYYGGGSGPGSGGGSSYISGHTGCVAITSNTDITPKSGCTTGTTDNNCSTHYSNKKFTNTIMIDGAGHTWSNTKGGRQKMPSSEKNEEFYSEGVGQNGDGKAQITLINETTDYLYTNKYEEYKATKTGTYKIELWGASVKYVDNSGNAYYHYGAYTSGEINLEKNDKLYVYVGEMGIKSNTAATYNGGGSSSKGSYGASGSQYYQNYPGGGATDIRLISGDWNNQSSLASRIMVAAGSGRYSNGGGLTSDTTKVDNSNCNTATCTYFAYGATQEKAGYGSKGDLSGSFGIGGNGEVTSSDYGSTGGGGGYYGGGGSYSDSWTLSSAKCSAKPSSGGSSYISGHTGCVAITSNTDITPKPGCTTGTTDNNCSTHYSNKKFTNTIMIDGHGNNWTTTKSSKTKIPNPKGNYFDLEKGFPNSGYAKITYLD